MRNAGTARFPDFLCIGAQKAGTTWLHRALAGHPDLWLPPLKEIHYFDVVHLDYQRDPETGLTGMDRTRIEKTQRMIERTAQRKTTPERLEFIHVLGLIGLRRHTDDWYGSIFAAAPETAKCGEITPEYALLPRAGIEHILKLSPQARFIFMLRDPIDRGWSDLRMVRARPHAKPFSELDRIKTKDFFARADYAATIARYREVAGRENLLTVYFDDVAERPGTLLETICDFLGVDFARGEFGNLEKPVHRGEEGTLPPDIYEGMKAALKPAYERLRALDSAIVESWYARHYG